MSWLGGAKSNVLRQRGTASRRFHRVATTIYSALAIPFSGEDVGEKWYDVRNRIGPENNVEEIGKRHHHFSLIP